MTTEKPKKLTYADSGVDIEKADKAKKALIKSLAFKRTGVGAPIDLYWGYAGLVDFGDSALVLCTDGVGTKLEVATAMKKWDTVGIDCIAMNVNDCICVGAEPMAIVDYLVLPRADAETTRQLGIGLTEGARQANVSIIGGETAIMPEIVNGIDFSATCLGSVKKDKIITGEKIQPGDTIIGVSASGVHSNGYTLIRRILREKAISYADPAFDGKTWGDLLIEPTRIYVRAIMELIQRVDVHGLANITGGGVTKFSRLNRKAEFLLDSPMKPTRLFTEIQKLGDVDTKEMYRTFNMGMGFAVIVKDRDADDALSVLQKHFPAQAVGRVSVGSGVWIPSLDLRY
ncbi:MAG: phosphoribosylformylglycinamidine cyclo-ligase [Euryarchaeota archaeon]|nr:phosphoribosylformylglycinamidine cyclo-ligase [Euryarchaeota archaeon]